MKNRSNLGSYRYKQRLVFCVQRENRNVALELEEMQMTDQNIGIPSDSSSCILPIPIRVRVYARTVYIICQLQLSPCVDMPIAHTRICSQFDVDAYMLTTSYCQLHCKMPTGETRMAGGRKNVYIKQTQCMRTYMHTQEEGTRKERERKKERGNNKSYQVLLNYDSQIWNSDKTKGSRVSKKELWLYQLYSHRYVQLQLQTKPSQFKWTGLADRIAKQSYIQLLQCRQVHFICTQRW